MDIGRFRQAHTALASGFGLLMLGLFYTWPSYTMELLFSNTTTPLSAPITEAEGALIGSLPSLGAMAGSAVTGVLMNKLGRRNAGIVLSLPVLISWAIIGIASSIKLILAARFLCGITGGASLVMSPIFISEVAEDSIRGALTSSPILLHCAGSIISYVIGWCMTYQTIIWINLFLSLLGVILMILVTESPMYFMRENREEDAKFAIARYRGVPVSSTIVADEFAKLKRKIMLSTEFVPVGADPEAKEAENEQLNPEQIEPVKAQSPSTIKLLFLQPTSRWAFTVVSLVITMQVLMGIVPVKVYAKTVFTESDPSKADVYTILFSVVLFFGSGLSTVITDRAGRRILIITSSALVSVCMISLGYLLQSKSAPPIVTVTLLFVYCFAFMFGAGIIPYVLLAEVFIPEVQSLASMIIVVWVWFLNFVVLGLFPYMNSAFGIYGSFYIFGIVGMCNAVTAYFIVPETKGLSNVEIQEFFKSR